MIDTYVTDFGNVHVGPMFKRAFDDLHEDLKKRKNSKAYKQAARRFDELDLTLRTLSRIYWQQGKVLTKTP